MRLPTPERRRPRGRTRRRPPHHSIGSPPRDIPVSISRWNGASERATQARSMSGIADRGTEPEARGWLPGCPAVSGLATRIGRRTPASRSAAPSSTVATPIAPRIEWLEGLRHPGGAETVAVSFDHRQKRRAARRGERARVGDQRVEVDVDPGAGRLGGSGHGGSRRVSYGARGINARQFSAWTRSGDGARPPPTVSLGPGADPGDTPALPGRGSAGAGPRAG